MDITRVIGAVVSRALEERDGKGRGRAFAAVAGILVVAGLVFVAYRLFVLDLILTLVRDRG
ncbi:MULTISPECIES: hypothetical protein [Actinoplanes]|uniref:hypothetical protein n=1 Tax=Actinoplanes TaxID=1865 RepID=UPI0005F2909F|nr:MULTISPECIES: hypothetical protein [Actinoplanes]